MSSLPTERPETQVPFRTGHMGYTFRTFYARGVCGIEAFADAPPQAAWRVPLGVIY
jgi:hypothetical protein